MARRSWYDMPSALSPVSAALLNDLDARKPEVDHMPIFLEDCYPGVVFEDEGASAKTANVTTLTAAINQANLDGRLIILPRGILFFTAGATFPVLELAPGFIGAGLQSTEIRFDTDGSVFVLRGAGKIIRDIEIINMATTHTAKDAVIRVKNCVGGDFRNITTYSEGANSRGFLLEAFYDGSADDAYTLVHVGAWYNTFVNVSCQYVTFASQAGYGLSLEVDSSAVSVVNPTGQAPGTYTGSVNFNTIQGTVSEGKDRGLYLNYASNNLFIGGQILGCNTQAYGRNSSSNVFDAVKWNQAVTQIANFDSTCYDNEWRTPTIYPQATAYGVLGERSRWEDNLEHTIGGSNDGLPPPAFGTNWSSSAGKNAAGFWKQGAMVYLIGMVTKSTTINQADVIFTLPVGHRPVGTLDFSVGTIIGGVNGVGVIRIQTGGAVMWLQPVTAAAGSDIELVGIVFRGI